MIMRIIGILIFLFPDKAFSLKVFEYAKNMHSEKQNEDVFFLETDDDASKDEVNGDQSQSNFDKDFDTEPCSSKSSEEQFYNQTQGADLSNNTLENAHLDENIYTDLDNNDLDTDVNIQTRNKDCKTNEHKIKTSSDTNTRFNYIWQHDDTKELIYSYGSHHEESCHPIKKKYFWDNIVNDLISQGYNVNKKMCIAKWNNLIRSYKNVKDSKTGRGPTKFLFFHHMDEILGTKPSNSSPHTMSSLKKKKISNVHNEKTNKNSDMYNTADYPENTLNRDNKSNDRKSHNKRCNNDDEVETAEIDNDDNNELNYNGTDNIPNVDKKAKDKKSKKKKLCDNEDEKKKGWIEKWIYLQRETHWTKRNCVLKN